MSNPLIITPSIILEVMFFELFEVLITPEGVINKPSPILTPPNITELATGKLYEPPLLITTIVELSTLSFIWLATVSNHKSPGAKVTGCTADIVGVPTALYSLNDV